MTVEERERWHNRVAVCFGDVRHEDTDEDCVGSMCPDCGCCMHCVHAEWCQCSDPLCACSGADI